MKGSKATLLIRPRLRHHAGGGGGRTQGARGRGRAKTDGIDGEALVRALLAYKRGEPRVCSMVRLPTPEDEDRRRLCRERKVLIAERVKHVNRIKGLLFSQGVSRYEPLGVDRRERPGGPDTARGAR